MRVAIEHDKGEKYRSIISSLGLIFVLCRIKYSSSRIVCKMVQKSVEAAAPEAKRRGRPRSYEPDVALGQAMEAFWKSGYAATSLDDLSAATGMNRPSLYAAFGDKQDIYVKAYQKYRARLREEFQP